MQISLQLCAIFRPVYGSLVLSSIGIGETFTWTEYCGWDRWPLQSPHLFLDTKLAYAVWPHGSSFPFPAWDSDQASLGRRELLLLPWAEWAGTSAWAVAGLSPGSSPRSPTLALEVDASQKWGAPSSPSVHMAHGRCARLACRTPCLCRGMCFWKGMQSWAASAGSAQA